MNPPFSDTQSIAGSRVFSGLPVEQFQKNWLMKIFRGVVRCCKFLNVISYKLYYFYIGMLGGRL